MVFITLTKTSQDNTEICADFQDWQMDSVTRVINSTEFVKIDTRSYDEDGSFVLYLKDPIDQGVFKCIVWGNPVEFGKLMTTGGVL